MTARRLSAIMIAAAMTGSHIPTMREFPAWMLEQATPPKGPTKRRVKAKAARKQRRRTKK